MVFTSVLTLKFAYNVVSSTAELWSSWKFWFSYKWLPTSVFAFPEVVGNFLALMINTVATTTIAASSRVQATTTIVVILLLLSCCAASACLVAIRKARKSIEEQLIDNYVYVINRVQTEHWCLSTLPVMTICSSIDIKKLLTANWIIIKQAFLTFRVLNLLFQHFAKLNCSTRIIILHACKGSSTI